MYKKTLEKMAKNEVFKDKSLSQEEVVELLKQMILNKSQDFSDLEREELKKNALKAFKNGLTILGLVHGAHYATKAPPKEIKIPESKVRTFDQKQSYSENPEIQQAYEEALQDADKTYKGAGEKGRQQFIDNFLKSISMNESSGGKNTQHKQMEGGIHAGDRALGSYGLMPNTIKEMAIRMGKDSPFYSYSQMDNSAVSDSIKKNPEHEHKIASYMANHLYDRFGGDESKMAYSWFSGHNLTDDHFKNKHKDYKNHDYVTKYFKHKKGLEQNAPKSIAQNDNIQNNKQYQ